MTLDSLLAHAESTSSTLNYLLLRLLSLHTSDLLSHAASHMGVAQTITTLLRALPYHAAQRRMVIPAEITAKHGVNQEAVFRSIGGRGVDAEENGKRLEEAVFELATVANDHVLTAREMFKEEGGKVPARVMPLFVSMVSPPPGNSMLCVDRLILSSRFLSRISCSDSRLRTSTSSNRRYKEETGDYPGASGARTTSAPSDMDTGDTI